MRCLLIDNFDSFTFNLFQYLVVAGAECHVVPNTVSIEAIRKFAPTHLVISPGPGTVDDARAFGVCPEAIIHFLGQVPIFGVCLGHQGIGKIFGMKVVRAQEICHGKIRTIRQMGSSTLFDGLQAQFDVMRYHSLAVTPTEESNRHLRVAATCDDGTVMAFEHHTFNVFGVQFHPESIGTSSGMAIIGNFLACSSGIRVNENAKVAANGF